MQSRQKKGYIYHSHSDKIAENEPGSPGLEETYVLTTFSIASRFAKSIKTLEGGEIRSRSLMFPHVPGSESEVETLKKSIFSNPMYNGTIVTRDGSATLIRTQFKEDISYERAFSLLQDFKNRYSDDEIEIYINGFPVLMGWIYTFKPQMQMVFAISLVTIILILYGIFRNFVGMIAPLAVGLISSIMGIGFVAGPESISAPCFLCWLFLWGPRKISHAVQITSRYLRNWMRRETTGSRHVTKPCAP